MLQQQKTITLAAFARDPVKENRSILDVPFSNLQKAQDAYPAVLNGLFDIRQSVITAQLAYNRALVAQTAATPPYTRAIQRLPQLNINYNKALAAARGRGTVGTE